MKTVAFTDWHEISFDGKIHLAQITLVSEKYYLTIKNPTRVFLISFDSKKIDVINEISAENARDIGVI